MLHDRAAKPGQAVGSAQRLPRPDACPDQSFTFARLRRSLAIAIAAAAIQRSAAFTQTLQAVAIAKRIAAAAQTLAQASAAVAQQVAHLARQIAARLAAIIAAVAAVATAVAARAPAIAAAVTPRATLIGHVAAKAHEEAAVVAIAITRAGRRIAVTVTAPIVPSVIVVAVAPLDSMIPAKIRSSSL